MVAQKKGDVIKRELRRTWRTKASRPKLTRSGLNEHRRLWAYSGSMMWTSRHFGRPVRGEGGDPEGKGRGEGGKLGDMLGLA